ncbi:glutamate receptor ionotropic, delta-1-like [Daphnia pulex]|uniref:glutamate receptor ionotropic, delta-1-like n=1 Tax=Daphnia pulex TaxID=6669 RepID=UPI001EDD3F09|nr:glutamate receptor ionotropic, delta-1-like [Daphnia pulex]
MVPVEVEMEPAVGRGQMNYIIDKVESSFQQSDLLVHYILPTIHRNTIVDLTLPWTYDHFALLIPAPDETANINAVVKPFQWPIWLGVGVSIACVIEILNSIQQYLDRSSFRKETDTMELGNKGAEAKTSRDYKMYVFAVLLSQGEPCRSKRLPIRLMAGAWCLAAFIFTQAYSSTLFTYIVAPVNCPLINSIYDVFEKSDVKLLVREGTVDRLIQKKDNPDVFTKIVKKLESYPNSRCAYLSECLQQVKPGSRTTFLESNDYLKDAMRAEFKKTGNCNLQLANEGFTSIIVSLALPKNSPYTTTINLGLLQLQQTGLMDYWDLWFRPLPSPCNEKPTNGKSSRKKNPSLSFKNLTGAFLVIAVGLCLSILVFLLELIVSMAKSKLHLRPKVTSNRIEKSKKKLPSTIKDESANDISIEESSSNIIEVE